MNKLLNNGTARCIMTGARDNIPRVCSLFTCVPGGKLASASMHGCLSTLYYDFQFLFHTINFRAASSGFERARGHTTDGRDSGPGTHRSGANAALVCADASATITIHVSMRPPCGRKKKGSWWVTLTDRCLQVCGAVELHKPIQLGILATLCNECPHWRTA